MQRNIHINKYLPVAVLYFFFNSLFLPLGLLYTALLAPVFLLWVCLKKRPTGLWIYLSVTLLYACIHFYNGVDPVFYLKSYILLLATYIFCVAFYVFVSTAGSFRGLFKSLLLINAIFTGMALVFLAIPALREIVWYNNTITSGGGKVERLKLFTYEASYYSTLLAPIALYYYLKILILKPAQKWLLFFMVTIPLLLSFSFGVILGVLLAVICVYLSDLNLLMENRKMIRNLW